MTHATRQAEVDALVKTIEQQRLTMEQLRGIIEQQHERSEKLVEAFTDIRHALIDPRVSQTQLAKNIRYRIETELADYRGTKE